MFHIRAPFFLFCFYLMEAKDSIKLLLCAKRQPPDMGLPSAAILLVLYRNSGNPFGRMDAEI